MILEQTARASPQSPNHKFGHLLKNGSGRLDEGQACDPATRLIASFKVTCEGIAESGWLVRMLHAHIEPMPWAN